MSISALTGAVLADMADCIDKAKADLGLDQLDRVLRYHGDVGLPEDCPTDGGMLSVATTWPGPGERSAYPVADLVFRYSQCWPKPLRNPDGSIVLNAAVDTDWDVRAAQFSEIADAGAHCLMRWRRCTEHGCATFAYLGCTPTGPRGGAAGWVWRARAAVRSGQVVSP